QKASGGKLDGSRRVADDIVEHRPLRRNGDAEIAMQQPLQKDEVALPQWEVEAPLGAEGGEKFRVRGCQITKLRKRGIARYRIRDKKDNERGEYRHHDGR